MARASPVTTGRPAPGRPATQGSPGVLQSVSIIRRIEKTRTNSVAHVGQR